MNAPATEITLSPEQQAACDAAIRWLEQWPNVPRPFFTIQGFAGTGKSFSVKAIIDRTGLKACYMAYTGKAALILRKYSGVPATTIHSRIYQLVQPDAARLKELAKQYDEAVGDDKKRLDEEIQALKKPVFCLRDDAFTEDSVELIVLDECSMVNKEMLEDLISFGIPIIALGDPGQLPPVQGEGALFVGEADAKLTEIRRQAQDNPIIKWSMWARTQRQLPSTDMNEWKTDAASKMFLSHLKSDDVDEMMAFHDITLCWKNETRRALNVRRRKNLGFYEKDTVYPVKGETIIFTKNDRPAGIFNGLFAEVVDDPEIFDTFLRMKVRPETAEPDSPPIQVNVLRACFDEYNDPDARKRLMPWDFKGKQEADFGYALTCHKAQGSQWGKVLVFEENVFNWFKPGVQEQRARWLYTAITRAAEKVTMIYGKMEKL